MLKSGKEFCDSRNLFLEISVLSDPLGDGCPFEKAIISSDAILLILSREVN
jgi:hypothetical protein